MMAAVDLTEAELYFSCNAFPCLEVKIPQLQNLVIVGVFQAEKHCRDFGMEIVAKQDLCVQSLLCFFYSFHSTRKRLSIAATSKTGAEYEEVPYVKYLENPTESSWNIIRWLVKHNYSDEDIAKVIGGNAIRVLQEVWA